MKNVFTIALNFKYKLVTNRIYNFTPVDTLFCLIFKTTK